MEDCVVIAALDGRTIEWTIQRPCELGSAVITIRHGGYYPWGRLQTVRGGPQDELAALNCVSKMMKANQRHCRGEETICSHGHVTKYANNMSAWRDRRGEYNREELVFQDFADSKPGSIVVKFGATVVSEAIQTLAPDTQEVLRIEFLNDRSILRRGGPAKACILQWQGP
ncbi:hypothetical protein B0H19DRAFT_1079453 [Mycena capillaripes]|nr:hypothetical protein B0H19DRAFT_1079453 [Mycena capillaripes]